MIEHRGELIDHPFDYVHFFIAHVLDHIVHYAVQNDRQFLDCLAVAVPARQSSTQIQILRNHLHKGGELLEWFHDMFPDLAGSLHNFLPFLSSQGGSQCILLRMLGFDLLLLQDFGDDWTFICGALGLHAVPVGLGA